eukprot:scaffold2318_cov21-Tisochrysis_lutea.AAC.2
MRSSGSKVKRRLSRSTALGSARQRTLSAAVICLKVAGQSVQHFINPSLPSHTRSINKAELALSQEFASVH